MRFMLFVLSIIIVVAGAFFYLDRDRGLIFGTDTDYCRDVKEKRAQPEYQFSYGERVAHVVRGCL